MSWRDRYGRGQGTADQDEVAQEEVSGLGGVEELAELDLELGYERVRACGGRDPSRLGGGRSLLVSSLGFHSQGLNSPEFTVDVVENAARASDTWESRCA